MDATTMLPLFGCRGKALHPKARGPAFRLPPITLPQRGLSFPRSSARAEPGGAEQLFLRGGLRAPILRRRRNLAAELGRRVPAPARVVQHATGERDHVGLPGGYDLFGLLG